MESKNCVFIGTSLDNYIADKEGGIAWLDIIPNPDQLDMGYDAFMDTIDALVMGRNTFETVLGFGIEWPYKKPVFVVSSTLTSVPEGYEDKVFLLNGAVKEIVAQIHAQGYHRLYIDGGGTVQRFLQEDLIDEMIITHIPVLLGGGIPLFADLPNSLLFECVEVKVYYQDIIQRHYKRKRT